MITYKIVRVVKMNHIKGGTVTGNSFEKCFPN
jgi:hypothetical protein